MEADKSLWHKATYIIQATMYENRRNLSVVYAFYFGQSRKAFLSLSSSKDSVTIDMFEKVEKLDHT